MAFNVCRDGGAAEPRGFWLGRWVITPGNGEQFGWSLGFAWKPEPAALEEELCKSSSVVAACLCHKLVIHEWGTRTWQM